MKRRRRADVEKRERGLKRGGIYTGSASSNCRVISNLDVDVSVEHTTACGIKGAVA